MKAGELLRIAGRYSLAWRQGYLSSFLSLLSVLGMVLAIALLILVLSVMNGFDREMRENILALVPQLTIKSWQPMEDWERRDCCGPLCRAAGHAGARPGHRDHPGAGCRPGATAQPRWTDPPVERRGT